MKQQIFHVGLVCLMVINPYFLSAQEAGSENANAVRSETAGAVGSEAVVLDLDAIYRLADEESRVIRVSEASLRAALLFSLHSADCQSA